MRKSSQIAALATMAMLVDAGLVQGNNLFNFKNLFKLQAEAEVPTLQQMDMGGATTQPLSDILLGNFLDLAINWNASVTEQQKWDILTNQLQMNNYLSSTVTSHLTLRDILAKAAIYTANDGKFSSPIGVFNPLDFVGDPRDNTYLYRDNVRRSFYDMQDNAKKAPTFLALQQMIQLIQPKIQDLAAGTLTASNSQLLSNIQTYMRQYMNLRDASELKAHKKALEDAQNTLYPSKASFTYQALSHGGWKEAELTFHRIGNCPHGLAIFAPWHREEVRQFEEAMGFHLPGFRNPYLDWNIAAERGMTEYFLNSEVFGDFSDKTEANLNLYEQQILDAKASLTVLTQFSDLLGGNFAALDFLSIRNLISTNNLPFKTDFFFPTNTLLTADSLMTVKHFLDNNIIAALKKFIENKFKIVSEVRKNPHWSSFNNVLGHNVVRYQHDYTNETDFVGSQLQQKIKNYGMDYQVSYIMHSPQYELNFQEGATVNDVNPDPRQGLQQMGVGFRARLEGAHDFMHEFIGGINFYKLKNQDYATWQSELGLSAQLGNGDMNIVQVAAFDPAFWYHHMYVDYLYAEWQTALQTYAVQQAAASGKTLSISEAIAAEYPFYPSWLWEIPLQPVGIWQKTVKQSHFDDFPIYQRSEKTLQTMTRLNTAALKKGYIVSVLNLPINWNGETYNYHIYAQLKNGNYAYVAGLAQQSNNYNINPYMWEGMATGTYQRSTYVPDYVYADLKANATTTATGQFNFAVITTAADPWPVPGTSVTLDQLKAMSTTGDLFNANIAQTDASKQFFLEPTNYWNSTFSLQNNRITQDINSEAYYYGSVVTRLQEKARYASNQLKTPIRVYSGSAAILKRFTIGTTVPTTSWTNYDLVWFGQLQFVKRNALAILYRRNKSTKKEEIIVMKQANGAGDFDNFNLQVNFEGVVGFTQTGRTYDLSIPTDAAIARPWVNLMSQYPATTV